MNTNNFPPFNNNNINYETINFAKVFLFKIKIYS